MKLDEVILRLNAVISRGLAEQKRIIQGRYNQLKDNEDFMMFYEIFNKPSYTLEDINDLLIFYSDHNLTNDEIIDLVNSKRGLFYDENQFSVLFSLKNVIFSFLLNQNNKSNVVNALKCFKTEKTIENGYTDFNTYFGLNTGETLYDLYNLFESIKREPDLNVRKRKTMAMMCLVDYSIISRDFLDIGITFDDIEKFLADCDKNCPINLTLVSNLTNNQLRYEKRHLRNEELEKKVVREYEKYSKQHVNFLDSDFIKYYNETFNDDFSCFCLNSKEIKPLTLKILYSLTRKYTPYTIKQMENLPVDYLDKFDMLSHWGDSIHIYVSYEERDSIRKFNYRKSVLEKYASFLETLKQPFKYTLKYNIYNNVEEKDRDEVFSIISWYVKNDKDFFKRDITKNSHEQIQDTKNVIYDLWKKEALSGGKKAILYKKYTELCNKVLGLRTVSAEELTKKSNEFEMLYQASIGVVFIREMLDELKNGRSLISYLQLKNIEKQFSMYCEAVSYRYPDLTNNVSLLMNEYNKEVQKKDEEARNLELENKVSYYSDIIRSFLAEKYKTKEAFLKDKNLTDAQFNHILEAVEKFNTPLYLEFMSKFTSLKNQRYLLVMKTIDYVLNALVNGVEDNGVVRPFDFMDYCMLTKLSIDEFAAIAMNANKLNKTNIRQFRQFQTLVKSYKMVTNKYIMDEKYIVNINGEMHEVTSEEKELALRFLRIKKLDNYYTFYRKAVSKVLSGEITREILDNMEFGEVTDKRKLA